MKPFDAVILLQDLSDELLFDQELDRGPVRAGTSGNIVDTYADGEAFGVEFFDREGNTIAVTIVNTNQLRLATPQDHAARRTPV